MSSVEYGPINYDWMFGAMETVRQRMFRATAALEAAAIPYAVVGGHAVAAWVARVDRAAVRATQDVDILVRRADFEGVKAALSGAGFIHTQILNVEVFLDGESGRARDAVHLLFAQEKVKPSDLVPTPDVSQSVQDEQTRVIDLQELVQMKLTSYRDKDRMHLRDMIEVGLVDGSWPSRLSEELAPRLQHLLDTPDG